MMNKDWQIVKTRYGKDIDYEVNGITNYCSSASHSYNQVSSGIALIGLALTPVARLLRPLPVDASSLAIFVIGVLPNFGAGLALPFFLYVALQKQIWKDSSLIHIKPAQPPIQSAVL